MHCIFFSLDGVNDNEANNDDDDCNLGMGSKSRNPRGLGSRRNTFSQPVITDKGDGTHDVSYVPPPVGDPYEVEYLHYLRIPTSWPSSLAEQQPRPRPPPQSVVTKSIDTMMLLLHWSWHECYFASNPTEENLPLLAFLVSEILSLIFVPNIKHFKG